MLVSTINAIALGAEYLGDMMLCIGTIAFLVLLNSEDSLD